MRKPRSAGRVTPNGELIKRLLGEKGWYPEELEKRLKGVLTPRTIDNVFAGKRVEIATLEAVALAMGVPYGDIVAKDVPALMPGVHLTCERTSDGLVVKFQGEITIQAESPEKCPQIQAFIEFLKMSLPDSADIRLLSIGAGFASFLIAKDVTEASPQIDRVRAIPSDSYNLQRDISITISKTRTIADPIVGIHRKIGNDKPTLEFQPHEFSDRKTITELEERWFVHAIMNIAETFRNTTGHYLNRHHTTRRKFDTLASEAVSRTGFAYAIDLLLFTQALFTKNYHMGRDQPYFWPRDTYSLTFKFEHHEPGVKTLIEPGGKFFDSLRSFILP